MSSELKLSGTTARVILQGNDSISSDQTFTFPDTGGEVATSPTGGSIIDYQQGTWTPDVSQGDVSFSDAWWTRVGNLVTVWCANMTFTDHTTSQTIEILGFSMPYLCVTPTNTSCAGACNASNIGREPTSVQLTNGNRFRFSGTASSKTAGNLVARYADIGDGGAMRFTATYLTADTTWTPQDGATVS